MSFKDTIQLLKSGKNPLRLQADNNAGLKNVRNGNKLKPEEAKNDERRIY